MFASVIRKLVVRNFRGFEKLDLDGLRRVNLIVGKNNCGKTSLLEAIFLSCQPHLFDSKIPDQLRTRPPNIQRDYLRWLVRDGTRDEALILREPSESHVIMAGPQHRLDMSSLLPPGPKLSSVPEFKMAANPTFASLDCRVVSLQQRTQGDLTQLLDRVLSLKDGEERMEGMLRSVDPRLKKIRVRAPKDELPFIELDLGLSERMPLAQAGHGMSRLVALFSELLAEKTDVCLVDEVESGLHYSLLPQLWRGIATVARDRGVQVFVTTHSYECVEAAHEAMSTEPDYDFSIVQLFRSETDKPLDVQGRVLDRSLIEAAIEGDVDLR